MVIKKYLVKISQALAVQVGNMTEATLMEMEEMILLLP
jgi:hypothetical protein